MTNLNISQIGKYYFPFVQSELPEGGIFPALEDEIRIWSQVTSGEKQLGALVSNILVSQLLRAKQLDHRLFLSCHFVEMINIEVVKISYVGALRIRNEISDPDVLFNAK